MLSAQRMSNCLGPLVLIRRWSFCLWLFRDAPAIDRVEVELKLRVRCSILVHLARHWPVLPATSVETSLERRTWSRPLRWNPRPPRRRQSWRGCSARCLRWATRPPRFSSEKMAPRFWRKKIPKEEGMVVNIRGGLAIAAPPCLAALLYCNTLNHGFVYDDR